MFFKFQFIVLLYDDCVINWSLRAQVHLHLRPITVLINTETYYYAVKSKLRTENLSPVVSRAVTVPL